VFLLIGALSRHVCSNAAKTALCIIGLYDDEKSDSSA